MDEFIYLDNNATTPLDPAVLSAMMPYFTGNFANASSITHAPGRRAAEAVEQARIAVGALLGANPQEITFTSGATEAINMVMKGIFERYQSLGKHIITCQSEHKAVLDTCAYLEKKGAEITYLPVNEQGLISLDALAEAIRPDTILITIMYANNETGVIQPIASIGQLAREKDILFFSDATQAIGKIDIDLSVLPVDILCLSAHKMYGPKGIGALYVRRRSRPIQVAPFIHGGKQENGLRAGTLNVPAIVGCGKAAELAKANMGADTNHVIRLRALLESELLTLPETEANGAGAPRLPHVSNITFRYLRASNIMTGIPHMAVSSGSACVSGSRDPSHVLLAMGLSPEEAHASIRFSLGRFNTEHEIDTCISLVKNTVGQLRAESPIWQLFQAGHI